MAKLTKKRGGGGGGGELGSGKPYDEYSEMEVAHVDRGQVTNSCSGSEGSMEIGGVLFDYISPWFCQVC
jgi:hypothetical protein